MNDKLICLLCGENKYMTPLKTDITKQYCANPAPTCTDRNFTDCWYGQKKNIDPYEYSTYVVGPNFRSIWIICSDGTRIHLLEEDDHTTIRYKTANAQSISTHYLPCLVPWKNGDPQYIINKLNCLLPLS